MANENLEKKCEKAILRMSSNVESIRNTLKDIELAFNHIVESHKDYYTGGYDKHSGYY
ncbi:MAG: hypothetical protein LHV68_09865 [Elusimicrobia bacterium]|nr:hypothetical protein [Candidatus Liberimonas magnetica]